MDFLTNINLNKNELQNAVIQNLSVAPSNPKAGQIYYNSTDKLIYQFDGTNWVSFGGQIDRLASDPASPKTNQVYFNTTNNVLRQYTGSEWVNIANYSTGTVTSVQVQATSPVQSSVSTAQTGSLNTTISLADGYGDTKNPYAAKNANYVLVGPSSGSAAAPTFRALAAADIPNTVKVGSASFADDSTSNANNPVKLTIKDSQSTAADLAAANIPKVSSTSAGVAPKGAAVTTQSQTTKFLREDGTWAAPSYTADPSGTYLPLAGGTMTGNIAMGSNSITGLADPTNNQDAATKNYVDSAISGLPTPMQFKGTVGTSGTIEWSALPTAGSTNEGFTYKVITTPTASQISGGAPDCKEGDTIVSNGSVWVVIPSGDEPAGTVTNVATGNGLSGGPITSTGTISLATAYGDTVNPYAAKTKNYVLAGPDGSSGHTADAVPSFRALVYNDIASFTDSTPTDTHTDKLITSAAVYAAIQQVSGGAVTKKIKTNPALTASGGAWTWTINGSDILGTADISVTVYEVATGTIVIPDVAVNQTTGVVTITINDTSGASSLAAGTYKAVMMG